LCRRRWRAAGSRSWGKDSSADAGFLKIDLLGLGMLSAVERCVEHIAQRRGERIDLSPIPLDDKPTFKRIQNADTTGVFQIRVARAGGLAAAYAGEGCRGADDPRRDRAAGADRRRSFGTDSDPTYHRRNAKNTRIPGKDSMPEEGLEPPTRGL
jgi:hypothetical protein